MEKSTKAVVAASMMAAMTCIATMIIKVPTPGTNGYVNVGDCVVLLSAWLLGNPYGALAAGIGSALADILSGYAVYAPGTAVIKALMALTGALIISRASRTHTPGFLTYILSSIVAEAVMVFGYLMYESTLLGYGSAAIASVPANLIQGIVCAMLANALIHVLIRVIDTDIFR